MPEPASPIRPFSAGRWPMPLAGSEGVVAWWLAGTWVSGRGVADPDRLARFLSEEGYVTAAEAEGAGWTLVRVSGDGRARRVSVSAHDWPEAEAVDAILRGLATAGLVAAGDAVEVLAEAEDYRRRREYGRVAREFFGRLDDEGD